MNDIKIFENEKFENAVTAIWKRYREYGIQRDLIKDLMKSGMEANGLTLRSVYNGMRMSLGTTFGVDENFTVEDVMDITGESRGEVLKRIEEMREEVAAMGENPDDYAKPVEAPLRSVHIFKNGL